MKIIKFTLMAIITMINIMFTTGCWNYREVDKFLIVGGVAIDKGTNEQYKITAEVLKISGGKDTETVSKIITMEGKTIFDAARNTISLSGKRLYWNHSKVIILSKDIANQGITKIIDWYNRDAETREDVYILISKEETAKAIFEGQSPSEEIKSFTMGEAIKNEASLIKAPETDILNFDIESQIKGISTIIPTVDLTQIDGQMVPQIMGTAIIKDDKLAGFLDGEETKYLNFIRNEVKSGILIQQMQISDIPILVSLEIFKSKTKVTPILDESEISMNLSVETEVAIDEIGGSANFFDEEGKQKLEQSAECELKERIEALIKKVQLEYDADIFGFGAKLREDKVKAWNSVSDNWDEVFKDLKVNVKVKVNIKNSAALSKSFEEGE